MNAPKEIKLYFDYKSPFAYLASGPAFELDRRFQVRVRWIPIQLRIIQPRATVLGPMQSLDCVAI